MMMMMVMMMMMTVAMIMTGADGDFDLMETVMRKIDCGGL